MEPGIKVIRGEAGFGAEPQPPPEVARPRRFFCSRFLSKLNNVLYIAN